MIVVALDVIVLASGIIGVSNVQSVPGEIVRRWLRAEFELVVSDHILDGLDRTFSKPYFARRAPFTRVRNVLLALRSEARLVSLTTRVSGIAPDREDNLVLSTALSGDARYLVTGDIRFRALGSFRDVRLLAPREFLAALDSGLA